MANLGVVCPSVGFINPLLGLQLLLSLITVNSYLMCQERMNEFSDILRLDFESSSTTLLALVHL